MVLKNVIVYLAIQLNKLLTHYATLSNVQASLSDHAACISCNTMHAACIE
jgi:hypothetical protein